MNEDEKKNLLSGLQRVQAGTETFQKSRDYIHRAGESQEPQFIPVLKGLVGRFSKTDKDLLVFDALHAQSKLGEGTDYFLLLASNHIADKMASYYAILILAREPNDRVIEALDQIKQQSSDNHIRGAVDLARFVAYQDEQFQKIKTVEAKADFLIENLQDGWNPIQVDEYGPRGNLSPVAVWSQRDLNKLSEAHPKEVAQKVFEIGASGAVKDASVEYRSYVARYIGKAAASELRAIESRK